LLELGVAAYLLKLNVAGVMAQRLVSQPRLPALQDQGAYQATNWQELVSRGKANNLRHV